MSAITIIGLGTMARVLGARSVAAGHSVQVIGRNGTEAAALAGGLGGNTTAGTVGSGALTGDLVVLAVPYAGAASIVSQYGDALAGKVIVDITNPLDLTTFSDLVTPDSSSAAQEIAKAAPAGAQVVRRSTPSSPAFWPPARSWATRSTYSSPVTMPAPRHPCPRSWRASD
jgi:predicted dinucleotide-binding enzyme